MNRKRIVVIATSLFLLTLLMFPTLLLNAFFGKSESSCGLLIAGAQTDNPCLAQEATITALELENLSLRATMTSLESAQATNEESVSEDHPTGSDNLQPDVLLAEDFSSNENGWDLSHGAGISNSALHLQRTVILIPVDVPNNFYFEVDVSSSCSGESHFRFGDITSSIDSNGRLADLGSFYEVALVHDTREWLRIDKYQDGEWNKVYEVMINDLPNSYQFGIWHHEGQLEIYMDDNLMAITQATMFGNQIMMVAGLYCTADYDNLELRTTK